MSFSKNSQVAINRFLQSKPALQYSLITLPFYSSPTTSESADIVHPRGICWSVTVVTQKYHNLANKPSHMLCQIQKGVGAYAHTHTHTQFTHIHACMHTRTHIHRERSTFGCFTYLLIYVIACTSRGFPNNHHSLAYALHTPQYTMLLCHNFIQALC